MDRVCVAGGAFSTVSDRWISVTSKTTVKSKSDVYVCACVDKVGAGGALKAKEGGCPKSTHGYI